MPRVRSGVGRGAVGLLVGIVMAGAAAAGAQPHGHQHGAGGQGDGHRRLQLCEDEFEAVVRGGLGGGLSFVADQQGYPGPVHALELKDRLGLDAAQEARIRTLLQEMFSQSRPAGERLLEAEARLRSLFGDTTPAEASVQAAVAAVERARAELRLVHLRLHLRTRAVLTESQRRAYQEARWGAR